MEIILINVKFMVKYRGECIARHTKLGVSQKVLTKIIAGFVISMLVMKLIKICEGNKIV